MYTYTLIFYKQVAEYTYVIAIYDCIFIFKCINRTPEATNKALEEIDDECVSLLNKYNIKIGIYPNRFIPIKQDWVLGDDYVGTQYREDIDEFYERFVKQWLTNYKHIIGMVGGCCGINDYDIKFMVNHLQADFPDLVKAMQKMIIN